MEILINIIDALSTFFLSKFLEFNQLIADNEMYGKCMCKICTAQNNISIRHLDIKRIVLGLKGAFF